MSSVFSLTMLAETLRIAAPYACAAAGGVWAERSGVIQIGLEGVLLTSAFTAVAVAHATGSAATGLLVAVLAGASLSLVHALLVERVRVHAVISGIALNLLAYAGTRLLLRGLYDSASNSPGIEGFRAGPTGSSGAALLARVLLDPVTLVAALAVAMTPWVLSSTRFGLRVRAAGENPVAAAAVGIDVTRVCCVALALSGAILRARRRAPRLRPAPLRVRHVERLRLHGAGCGRRERLAGGRAALVWLVFGALEALQIVLQSASASGSRGGDLVQLLPYAATLAVLAFSAGRAAAPRGLGKHADL